ncbi:type II toxin-antitoxin system HicB family antitoxin [Patescibacteria group bacterium]|nr:type II toxin-antitoxin system HicB family antitoxin [Patescibacteria group bacterium]
MKKLPFVAYIEQDEDGMFIGTIPAVPACHAEGRTQKEMIDNLHEVLTLCLRNINIAEIEKTKLIGVQNLEVKYA